jgi:hypothetical protein
MQLPHDQQKTLCKVSVLLMRRFTTPRHPTDFKSGFFVAKIS